jgi:hypothetical protein
MLLLSYAYRQTLENDMITRIACLVAAFAFLSAPSEALPLRMASPVEPVASNLVIKVATSYQKNSARRICRAKYGSRLAYVSFSRNRYTCHFRKSNKTLTKQAARSCRKSGLRLSKVTSIRIKGNRSLTKFVCRR